MTAPFSDPHPSDPHPSDPQALSNHADEQLAGALRGYQRLRWVAFGILAAIGFIAITVGGTVIYLNRQQLAVVHKQLIAGCDFFSDLARLPVDPVPPLKKPSKIGVSIVADSRIAATGLGCTSIPPASASLKKWAAYYHITLR